MALEILFNITDHERALQDRLVSVIQSHYNDFKESYCFIKLEKVAEKTSRVLWVKTFVSEQELDDFYFDSVFYRACVMFKYSHDRYQVLWHGYHWANWFQVFPETVSTGRGREEDNYDPEKSRMISKELLRGFDDLTSLTTKKRLKAV